MSLGYLITISGIFSKSDDLDILPPPPPFPEIGKEENKILEPKTPKKKEEIRKGRKARNKMVFDFFHGVGLVKTEHEKRELERQRLEYKKHREIVKRKIEEDRKKGLSRKKKLEKVRLEPKKKISRSKGQILSRIEDIKIQKPEGKTIFGKFFGKKEKTELDSELEDLEKLNVKEEIKGGKLEIPEFKFPEIEKDEEEIQEAISGIKVKEKSFIPKNFFKKKEHAEEIIETPEVMPRTYDKIDYVEEIEEKMHKARLDLMDFKFEEAKRVYIGIMRMYNQLEPKKRSKVYQDIKDLYYERKSAEKFMKK